MRISDWSSDVCSSDLFEPQAQNLFAAIGADAERDMEGLVADHAFIPDLDPDRVEEDQRINRVKRPLLPGGDLVEDRIGHRADQIGRDVDTVQIAQVPADLTRAHAPSVHRHDLKIGRAEEHTSELQSLMRISYAVFCLKKK